MASGLLIGQGHVAQRHAAAARLLDGQQLAIEQGADTVARVHTAPRARAQALGGGAGVHQLGFTFGNAYPEEKISEPHRARCVR